MSGPEPKVGDVVVYVGYRESLAPVRLVHRGDGTEYLVIMVDGSRVYAVESGTGPAGDWFWVPAANLRVVRRASYTDVQS